MSRWLSFRQPREQLVRDWPGAVEQLELFRLIGEVSLQLSGQELWFMPSGWNDAGLLWQQSTNEWILAEVWS